jgi:hypothetical protein
MGGVLEDIDYNILGVNISSDHFFQLQFFPPFCYFMAKCSIPFESCYSSLIYLSFRLKKWSVKSKKNSIFDTCFFSHSIEA